MAHFFPDPNWPRSYALRTLKMLEPDWPQATWRPRYSDTPFAQLSLSDQVLQGTIPGPDPHDAVALGIARCSQCWDETRQEATDPHCPVCYGVGWTGGYGPEQGLRLYVTDSDFMVAYPDRGENISLPGIKALHIARQLLLPNDVVVLNAHPEVRYLVGQMVDQAGTRPPMLARAVGLEPLNPTDFLRTSLPVALVVS